MSKTSGMIRCGGMGVCISGPPLAKAVAAMNQYGTVSGVALEIVLTYILQQGDPRGDIRRALATFPFQNVVRQIMDNYFVEGGTKATRVKYAPHFTVNPSGMLIALVVCANYAFVWLAKEGHDHPITINWLEKIAMSHPYATVGAMLAGIDCVTIGAGIALQFPSMMTAIVEGKPACYKVPVLSRTSTKTHQMVFDPTCFFGARLPSMKKPAFYPVISSALLARLFCTNKNLPDGSVAGFAVEEHSAAGHNAPPRKPIFDEMGRMLPVYGPKDEIDYPEIARYGLPFWIGGNHASPAKLAEARQLGAQGIQAGSIFALCDESGMNPALRKQLRALGYNGKLETITDTRISPTGYPFAVARMEETIAMPSVYHNRTRVCNHGVLVSLYERPDGSIGYRCPSEPVYAYVRKGGAESDTVDRGCLCNGLLTTADANCESEPAIVTLGNVDFLRALMRDENAGYTAADAIRYLLSEQ